MFNQDQVLNNLHSSINRISGISEEQWKVLSPCLTVKKIPKSDFLLKAGDFCNSVIFINQGYCRLFRNSDGKEVNINFCFENEFLTNIRSFTKKEKSEYAIQASENMVVAIIEKNKVVEHIYRNSLEFETFGRKMLEFMIIKQDEHLDLFKLYSPQQRYEYLEKKQPEIIRRVPLTQIASYLGVTRETLTRIRKKKLNKI